MHFEARLVMAGLFLIMITSACIIYINFGSRAKHKNEHSYVIGKNLGNAKKHNGPISEHNRLL